MKSKKTVIAFSIILGILVLVCIAVIALNSGGAAKKTAYIYSENKLIEAVDLSVGIEKELRVETDNGYNIIKISEAGICVSEADCPDKTCINTGYTKSSLVPVICMPHKLEIIVRDSEIGLDGVTG